ncbi:PREDICTED: condensin complex subunit 2 isoform X1 [Chinchilla lanigera]|uniref:condensin complex subunit 2 isoform X1 n=1 Tax=Chinchilla lanigera TaxID=34839 RepID=UPI00038EAC3C|nr:PREDICTED: condensin complex subunit 2 isoform X1 [Chinchilla lanigera]
MFQEGRDSQLFQVPHRATMSKSSSESRGHPHGASSPSERMFSAPLPRKAPLNTPGTPVLEDFPQNDDEKERLQRRRSRVFDLQFSTDSPHLLASPSSRSVDVSATIPKFTNTQITEHYSTCIKLSTENKITTKNAFGLHLIDFMSEILKQKDTEPTNFKVAAGTLDASTKIYAVRVDVVHADAYRVLGGLGKDAPSLEEAEDPGADGSAAEPGTTKKAPKPKKKHSYKTIEQNINNLNVSEADRKCEVDPMFQKTAASFDECSTAGVFLSTLHCQDYRSELLFPSDVQPLSTGESLELPDLGWVEMTDLKEPLQQCVEDRQLCPALAGFQFTQWDSDSHTESVSALVDKFKKNDQVFDADAEVEESDGGNFLDGPLEDDFDANDEPEHTATGDHEEFRSWKEPSQLQSCQEEMISLGDGDIRAMCPLLSMKPGEYSYFSPRTMKMWAGPDHWRFRPQHKQEAPSQSETRKKSTKKDFTIDFDEDIDFDVHFRKTKAATVLSKSTLENQNWRATTLPMDFHYEINTLVQLHLKPGMRLLKMDQGQKAGTEHYEEIGDYDYNNPNDTSNFCPGLQAADSDSEESDNLLAEPFGTFDLTSEPCHTPTAAQENGDTPEGHADITTYGESNLVAEPQKVNKIEIHYAKTAKKMDMKKLKQSMWSLLTELPRREASAEVNLSETGAGASVGVAKDKMLSRLTNDLQKSLPPTMAQNLSIPLAFACLLHLANEKNLKLEGTQDLSDVFVRQSD